MRTQKVLTLPKGIKESEIYKYLPYDEEIELGGYVYRRKIYYSKGDDHSFWSLPEPEKEKELIFHTHSVHLLPIPSFLDIAKILVAQSRQSILITEKTAIILDVPKNEFIKILVKVPGVDNNYMREAIQNYIYARTGIRKNLNREYWIDHWHEILEKDLGFKVKIHPR